MPDGARPARLALLLLVFAILPGPGSAADYQPDFPRHLHPEMPSDIDIDLKNRLETAGGPLWKLKAHRLFEKHAWQTLIALSWPVDGDGRPMPRIDDRGPPRWSRWAEAYQVFKSDGSAPDPWGRPRQSLPDIGDIEIPRELATMLAYPEIRGPAPRILHTVSSTRAINVLDDVNEAFSSAVWDQHGNLVHYEILINKEQYDYIVRNRLYNIEGQVNFFEKHKKIDFPSGKLGTGQKGALELKLAWKMLDPMRDDLDRYIVMPAYVPSGPEAPSWKLAQMGLVGFHIAQKTESSPQWIWSTFEHVDNVEVDLLATVDVGGAAVPLRPSFHDPDCEWCPVNVPPEPDENGVRRTQITRLVPTMVSTRKLNAQVQALLAEAGSKLRYYELIGVQWPVTPGAPPERGSAFPGAVTNKPGGEPFPVNLINAVMETYSQAGNLPADQHQLSVATSDRLVFGTASCMGCHFDAPSDDFSWLMVKARPRAGAR